VSLFADNSLPNLPSCWLFVRSCAASQTGVAVHLYSPLSHLNNMAKGGKRGVRVTRNPELVPGVRRYGAVASAKRSATYKHTKKGLTKGAVAHQAPVRAEKLEGKFYAADDTKVALRSHRPTHRATKLRKSIRAGTVVIVLAGRHRGKRVVVLKQLASGLLLVTGQQQQAEAIAMRGSSSRWSGVCHRLASPAQPARSRIPHQAGGSPHSVLLFVFHFCAHNHHRSHCIARLPPLCCILPAVARAVPLRCCSSSAARFAVRLP
jgi:hypothetical protein